MENAASGVEGGRDSGNNQHQSSMNSLDLFDVDNID